MTIHDPSLCRQDGSGPFRPIPTDASMFSGKGVFSPIALQRVSAAALEGWVEGQLAALGCKNQPWVQLAMSVEVLRPIGFLETLTYSGGCPGNTPPVYRWDFSLSGEMGDAVARGAVFFAPLDLSTRRIAVDGGAFSALTPAACPMGIPANSRFTEAPAFVPVEQRVVRPSWIDCLGHVNNARYGELAFDAVDAPTRERFGCLRRLDVWFLKELSPDAAFRMERGEERGAVYVRGVLLPEEKPSFVVKYAF